MTCIPVTTINSLSPVSLRDNKHSGHLSFPLEFAIQVKLTIYQNQRFLPTDESQTFRGGCMVTQVALKGSGLLWSYPLNGLLDDRIFALGFSPIYHMHLFLWDTGGGHLYHLFLLTLMGCEQGQLSPILASHAGFVQDSPDFTNT